MKIRIARVKKNTHKKEKVHYTSYRKTHTNTTKAIEERGAKEKKIERKKEKNRGVWACEREKSKARLCLIRYTTPCLCLSLINKVYMCLIGCVYMFN